jgi:chromate reductase
VAFEPFASKFVAVLNASPRASHADAALRETLTTMAAVIVEPASSTIALLGAHLDETAMIATPSVANTIRGSLTALHQAVVSRRAAGTAAFAIL